MKRTLIALCAVCLAISLAAPAMAEVQNIKVYGDIIVRGFYRDNFSTKTGELVGFNSESRDWYNTITELGIEADLTDNVTANILLGNQRDWGVEDAATGTEDQDVEIWSSYITLKEMLYSPLTIKAGRMPLQVANGLIIGDGTVGEDYLLASDYSAETQFDTVHGILNFDPMTIVFGTIKINDSAQTEMDDIDGYLLDVIYQMGQNNGVIDTYLVNCHYSSPRSPATTGTPTVADSTDSIDIWALASRLTMEPKDNMLVDLGLGYQFGDYQTGTTSRDLGALAIDAEASYTFQSAYYPMLGLKYVHRSGDSDPKGTGDYDAWLPLFENQVNGLIYDPDTNINALALRTSIMPIDRLTLGLDWWFYFLDEEQAADAGSTTTDDEAGQEIDLIARYAYTEDVTLGLSMAWFMPGNYYAAGNDETARQALLELAVSF